MLGRFAISGCQRTHDRRFCRGPASRSGLAGRGRCGSERSCCTRPSGQLPVAWPQPSEEHRHPNQQDQANCQEYSAVKNMQCEGGPKHTDDQQHQNGKGHHGQTLWQGSRHQSQSKAEHGEEDHPMQPILVHGGQMERAPWWRIWPQRRILKDLAVGGETAERITHHGDPCTHPVDLLLFAVIGTRDLIA